MRIIDYYNYIATAVCVIFGAAAVILCHKNSGGITGKGSGKELSAKAEYIILGVIMLVASLLRLYKLGSIPFGLQADEASIGYEAFSLANYGVDRNGYVYPVFPITWGCGGGSSLIIYLNMITVKLFGTGVIKLRMLPAIFGILTVLVFFFILKELFSSKAALFGTGFLAICPWHVILSRWSLDSNIMPLLEAIATYSFMVAIRKKKTWVFLVSAALYSLCMYGYGAATMTVPFHLLLICAYCLYTGTIKLSQVITSGVLFMVIFAPLFMFYAVNYLGVHEIITPYFSINKLTATRSGEVFIAGGASLPAAIWANFKDMILMTTVGNDKEMLCHYFPGYATLFEFTFPVTFIGIIVGFREILAGIRNKDASKDEKIKNGQKALWFFLLITNAILGTAIMPDISRMVMIFLPLIYFFIRGVIYIGDNVGKLTVAIAVMVLFAGVSFTKDYFRDFNNNVISIFTPNYGEAIARAYEIAGDDRLVYSTYEGLSAPFMSALYYTNYDPGKFQDTVVYKDPDAMFRIAESYGNFVFDDIPSDPCSDEYKDTVFVVAVSELEKFDSKPGCVEKYGAYALVYWD